MAPLSSTGSMISRARVRLRVSGLLLGCLFVLLSVGAAAAAPSGHLTTASGAKISAHLTKKSFTKAQAKRVKLVYRFSAPSKSFGYRLTFKKGSKWLKVKNVMKKGTFKGSHTITVKKLFAGKPVKVGRYRLKLSADGGSKLLSFKVVKATSGGSTGGGTTGGGTTPTGSAPTNSSLPTISGTTTQGQTLTASNGSWSNSPTSYTRQWRRCDSSGASCSDISGATSSSYILVLANAGSTIRVVVTASNSYGSGSVTSGQTAAVVSLAPVNTALPTIGGNTTEGRLLIADVGSWRNSPTSYTYQWRRCDSSGNNCSDVSSATSDYGYDLVLADVGSTIRVVVTATNSYGSASATSSQTEVVVGRMTATSLPTISGTTAQGHTLYISTGYWSNSPISYAYQWRRCDSSGASCSDISGATSNSYIIVPADAGSTIRARVTATGHLSDGSGSATSSQTMVVASFDAATQISAGGSHTCALLSSGTVECWGDNGYGQVGNAGRVYNISTPVQVVGVGGVGMLSNVTQISAGGKHTCALLSGGTVECWGYNDYGQLGDGTTDTGPSGQSSTPVVVSGISNATQISAGGEHTCALLSGGAIKCWGYNGFGQLGDDTTADSSTPVSVSGITTATQVSVGRYHTCALLSGGTTKCWGYNGSGQLGDDTTADSSTPVLVSGITTATQVSAGYDNTCALLSGGTIKCWGNGNSTPVLVSGITTATQVSADGAEHTCALLSDHTVSCWGSNGQGELGNGAYNNSSLGHVEGVGGGGTITNVTQVAVGLDHTCALLSGGTIACWGYNYNGQLGNGESWNSSTPVSVSGITTATQVVAGGDHTCALLSDSTVKCWGYNGYGQLGASFLELSNPVQVSGIGGTGILSNVTQISGSEADYTCALLSNGTVACWGYNDEGELGNGTTTDSSNPVQVEGVGGTGTLTNVTQISSSGDHTCALLSGGTAVCWGANNYGGLGNGNNWDSATPVQVEGIGGTGTLTDVTQISAGGGHTCAVLSDHTIVCWGSNNSGQLGNGEYGIDSDTPVQVEGEDGLGTLSNVTQVSAGGWHTCALLSDALDPLVCWGYDLDGQLGDGNALPQLFPVEASFVGTATQISAGYEHTCGLLSGGAIKCWGREDEGELGNGSTTIAFEVVPVSDISTATQVSTGVNYTCAVLSDHMVKCWGENNVGQLGNGVFWDNSVPVSVVGLP